MRPTIACLAIALLPAAGPAADPDPKKHGWHTDYAAARAEARRTGKPMLVVFRCEP